MSAFSGNKLWILWLVAGMALASCGSAGQTAGSTRTPIVPATASISAPTTTSAPAAAPGREPIELTVLHTNDNWGETEPCG